AARGISANRRTIVQDIDQLQEFGLDIICNKSRQNQYFVGSRAFELPELQWLADAAQASKWLSGKHTQALIHKLTGLASRHQAEELRGSLCPDGRIKPKTDRAYIAAEILRAAIHTNQRVRFMYYEYGPDKQRLYKHNRQVYEFSPYAFIWSDDRYYVAGHSESHGRIATFRVDRIAAPELTEEPAVPRPENWSAAEYIRSAFRMYDGPKRTVTLRCENALMKAIIDRFGESVETQAADAGHFRATADVLISKAFYGWVFAYDGAVEILSPREAAEEYRAMLGRAVGKV
ncbi:MAG: WYL domain-containing protein, partial [Gracilibacteraceae bacterium]|nr:WYL domain-containing protein [Gracilibacteraceae bacterium]